MSRQVFEETPDYALARTAEGWEVTYKRTGEKTVHPTCHDAERALRWSGVQTVEATEPLPFPTVSGFCARALREQGLFA